MTDFQAPDHLHLSVVRFGEIRGAHKLVHAVRSESCGYLRDIPNGVFTIRGLLELAHHVPLHVVAGEGEYWCIGGLRLFRLLQLCASADTRVPVLAHEDINKKVMKECIQTDLLVIPSLLALHYKDRGRLGKAWAQLADTALFNRIIATPGVEAFASLIGCDLRTVTGAAIGSLPPNDGHDVKRNIAEERVHKNATSQEGVLTMKDNPEIIMNLWFVADHDGYIHSLRAKAYVGHGSDQAKTEFLLKAASTDYLSAQQFPIPQRFRTIFVSADHSSNPMPVIRADALGCLGGIPALFDDVYEVLAQQHPVSGSGLAVDENSLRAITPLVPDADGVLRPTGLL